MKREFVELLKQKPELVIPRPSFCDIFSVKVWWGSNAMMHDGRDLWRDAAFARPAHGSSLGRYGPWIFGKLEAGGACHIEVWHEQSKTRVATFRLQEVRG